MPSRASRLRASFQATYSVFGLTIDSIATRTYSFLSKRAFDAYSFLIDPYFPFTSSKKAREGLSLI
jgi:hypothetical protein